MFLRKNFDAKIENPTQEHNQIAFIEAFYSLKYYQKCYIYKNFVMNNYNLAY